MLREWLNAIPDPLVPEGKIVLLNEKGAVLDVIEIGVDVPNDDAIAFIRINPKDFLERMQFSAENATKH